MSAATSAIKVVVVMIAVGAVAKVVGGAKNPDAKKKPAEPVAPPITLPGDPGGGTKNPDPIRTGHTT